MPRRFEITVTAAIAVNLLSSNGASAQDFPDVQTIANRVLFAKEDVAAERRAVETRRVEALDQRAKMQDAILQEQAVAVQKIGGELQTLRDERQIIELAATFDATIAARQWPITRSLLTDSVTVDLVGGSDAGEASLGADAFIADLSKPLKRVTVLPRSNQQVAFAADRAILTSDGLPWSQASGSKVANDRVGKYEYRFVRTPAGWRIDGLFFHFST